MLSSKIRGLSFMSRMPVSYFRMALHIFYKLVLKSVFLTLFIISIFINTLTTVRVRLEVLNIGYLIIEQVFLFVRRLTIKVLKTLL